MLGGNEIERPITVKIRPRKSRHGGVSTQIVSKGQPPASKGPEKGQGLGLPPGGQDLMQRANQVRPVQEGLWGKRA